MPPALPRKISLVLALSGALLAGFVAGVFSAPGLRQFYTDRIIPESDQLVLKPVTYADLPGWNRDSLKGFVGALHRSCRVFLAQKPDRPVGPKGRYGEAQDWAAPCRQAAALPEDISGAQIRDFLEREFLPLAVRNRGRAQGKFTGYYEPELRGSLQRHGDFQVPLLRAPEDLVSVDLGQFSPQWRGQRIAGRVVGAKLKPLQDRGEISAGALASEKLELLYVDDPVDAFFLHIQGSGRVRLDDGRVIRLGYAGQNGRPYVAIGKTLVQSGALSLENVSMQSIRAWLEAHPAERDAVLDSNPSYIFFRMLQGGDPELGPPGAQNVQLTPGRSLAVDADHHALGVPVWLDTIAPSGKNGEPHPLQRLMVAQDTGGAIRGPVRGDVFWGFGGLAAATAGRMNSDGRMYVLLPRAIAARAIQERE
ncbi:MAG: MltA domain-containing protein [Alphaproteobacteria bacterium]|nr:MltA domain-containing protein [Alphaproteobacteria bacterium]